MANAVSITPEIRALIAQEVQRALAENNAKAASEHDASSSSASSRSSASSSPKNRSNKSELVSELEDFMSTVDKASVPRLVEVGAKSTIELIIKAAMSVPTNDPNGGPRRALQEVHDPKTQPLDIVRRAVIFAKRAANDQRRNQKRAEGLSTIRQSLSSAKLAEYNKNRSADRVEVASSVCSAEQQLKRSDASAGKEAGQAKHIGGVPREEYMRLIATAKEWLADAKATERELNEAQARVLQSEIAARSAPPPAAQSASAPCEGKATCCTRPPPRSRLTPSSQEAGQTPPPKAQRAAAALAKDAAYAASVAAESSSDAGGATPGVSAQLLSATHADARPALAALRAK